MAIDTPPPVSDVLICGSGSAGICAAAWLARCGIRCTVLESREGPLELGQADGVQCRTVEVFESFGLGDELLRDAYHVLEVAFWSSKNSENGELTLCKRIADRENDISHQPHVILNQARVNGILLEGMKAWNGQTIDYGYRVKGVDIDNADENYPVAVTTEKNGQDEIFRAKYVLGCDGAHSAVRKSMGIEMIGDSTNSIWGVMDIYPRTDFPDIRRKVIIETDRGNLLIIPREGGDLCRFYIELGQNINPKDVKLEDLQSTARQIFHPYSFEAAGTFWWSAYSIGQRLANGFARDNRVFLTGDACHTHSPKAGQGMNTSLQDGYNIGWKLAAVLKGQSPPSLLETYSLERGMVAADLIAFDRELTAIFSSKAKGKLTNGVAQKFSDHFMKAARYTAGMAMQYPDSSLTCATKSTQSLASNLPIGMRFPSVQVVRFCDARAMHLVRALPADGRWRIVVFSGDVSHTPNRDRLDQLAAYLNSPTGPARTNTPPGDDLDSFIEPILVLSGNRQKIEQRMIPQYFTPINGKWQIRDLHKVFIDDQSYNDGHGQAYTFYGVDVDQGAVAIVRPDGYISMVTDLADHEALGNFFKGFATPAI